MPKLPRLPITNLKVGILSQGTNLMTGWKPNASSSNVDATDSIVGKLFIEYFAIYLIFRTLYRQIYINKTQSIQMA